MPRSAPVAAAREFAVRADDTTAGEKAGELLGGASSVTAAAAAVQDPASSDDAAADEAKQDTSRLCAPVTEEEGERTFFAPLDEEDTLAALERQLREQEVGTHFAMDVGFGVQFGDEAFALLVAHPKLAAVTHFSLRRASITPAGLRLLLDSELAPRLAALDLRSNLLGLEGAKLLAETRRLVALKELNLGRNFLHSAGAKALAMARGLEQLERLELGYNLVGAQGARALLGSAAFPRLRHLGLSYSLLGPEDGEALTSQVALGRLECLDLRFNELEFEALDAVASSQAFPLQALVFGAGNSLTESEETELEGRHAIPRIVIGQPLDLPGQIDGLVGGDLPRRQPRQSAGMSPPETLPTSIEYRELWIWEFGLVAEYPTFLTPESLPGNGKSRSFSWLDRAGYAAGGWWALSNDPDADVFAAYLSDTLRASAGEKLRVEYLGSSDALLWRQGPERSSVERIRVRASAQYSLLFWYPTRDSGYFRPIAERCVRSLYFEASP